MTGLLFTLYGAACYVVFFLTFLYAIAFVGNLPFAPKTIDSGTPGALIPSLLVDAALLGLFAVQHSLMARPAFKRIWTKIVPQPIERSTYVLFASLALITMYVFWRPLPEAVWTTQGVLAAVLTVLFWIGWGVVLISTFLISHFELFGLKQVWDRLRRKPAGPIEFRTPGFYKAVRHPIYLGFILAFWSAPVMSQGHLLFAIATLGYILIAIQLEEHDLIGVFGDRYRAYKAQVGMLIPKLGGKGKPERAA